MKYFRFSISLLAIAIISNTICVLADDTFPISGSLSVKYSSYSDTAERTKVNYNVQEFKVSTSTCDSCTYLVRPCDSSGCVAATTFNIGEEKYLTSDSVLPGTVYAQVKSKKFSLTSHLISYVYDPNDLT